jgi:hypothetical protein
VGRTNGTILALGLFACVALSLIMKHAVTVADTGGGEHAVVRSVHDVFDARLAARSRFAVEAEGKRRVGVLTIFPRSKSEARHLARGIGAFVWRVQSGPSRLDALDVVSRVGTEDEGRRERVFQRVRKPAAGAAGASPAGAEPAGVEPAGRPSGR